MSVPQISVQELAADRAAYRVLDVREADELAVASIPDVVHVPLALLPANLDALDRDADWAVLCRSGFRSARATEYLLANGFRSVRNVEGGILAWSEGVDPSVRTY